MLSRILNKIFGRSNRSNEGSAAPVSRNELGLKHIGEPTTAFLRTVTDTMAEKCGPDFRSDAVLYYAERVFCKWIPTLIDDAYTDEQLAELTPEKLRSVYLALLWDMLRHNRTELWSSPDTAQWVDALCAEIALRSDTQYPDVFSDNHVFDIYNIDNDRWADELGKYIGVPGVKLFACHSALVAGVVEKVESTQ